MRKKGFHKAFFADLGVEREVDIRKRVGAIFNKRQDEFETLLDWNNYLEEVEGLIFDLVEGTKEDKAKAEERLRAYKEGFKSEIEENMKAEHEEMEIIKQTQAMEKEAAKQRRLAQIHAEEESKADLERSKRDVIDKLATTDGDANKITKQATKVILKKAASRRTNNAGAMGNLIGTGPARDTGLTIRGLKRKTSPVAEKPYDPFGGYDLAPTRYVLQENYESEWLEMAKKDLRHAVGGYSLQEYYARTMFEAFSGLGVFVEDEMATRQGGASSGVGTAAAAAAAVTRVKQESDDVF